MNTESPFTVTKALSILSDLDARRHGNDLLVIPYDSGTPSIGGQSSTPIVTVFQGFDWDAGHVFLKPSQPLGVAGKDLLVLKRHLQEAVETLYFIERDVRNTKLDPLDRLRSIQNTLRHYKKQTKTISDGEDGA